jgi:thymidylate synthase ThyX
MTHSAKILARSISPEGVPLTTMEVTFPRSVLAEFNTHRMLGKNSASSRAIPHKKMVQRVVESPYIPQWTRNQSGMSGEFIDPRSDEAIEATNRWLWLRDRAVETVEGLGDSIHKQDINRALEPWMWHTCIVTATEWSNFFHLRDHPKAHPAIQTAAKLMRQAYEATEPEMLVHGDWHLPLIFPEDFDAAWEQGIAGPAGDSEALQQIMVKISVARCARVSYLTHDGKRDLAADLKLHDQLLQNGHMSPFEHVARPLTKEDLWTPQVMHPGDYLANPPQSDAWSLRQAFAGNLRGWFQYRKMIANEHDILGGR